jgi:UDPglucose--hexose-1-phosphate uridylyltransferase
LIERVITAHAKAIYIIRQTSVHKKPAGADLSFQVCAAEAANDPDSPLTFRRPCSNSHTFRNGTYDTTSNCAPSEDFTNKMINLAQDSHRRYNPLTREWVLVSPGRTSRPWQGHVESPAHVETISYDPECYMCPGNVRVNGTQNPKYSRTFVFDNDFPAMTPNTSEGMIEVKELLVARGEPGICRVVCFSPEHNLRVPRMDVQTLREVIDVLAEQHTQLGALPWVNYVLPFENSGPLMGASNPHPHCQIWANGNLPNEPSRELTSLGTYLKSHGSCMLCDYVKLEIKRRERIICDNKYFAAIVPFWAVWPFEAIVISKKHAAGFPDLSDDERDSLAEILIKVTTRYDNLFKTPFPYSMGYHCAPTDGAAHPEWHFHAHFYPPLLRSANVRKFQVGYEMLGMPQRDITAEHAAKQLRDVQQWHYLENATK